MSRSSNKSTAWVIGSMLYGTDESIALDSVAWVDWLAQHQTFYYNSHIATFTARRELRRGCWYWYAFKKHNRKLLKAYLGRSGELTPEKLESIAKRFANSGILASK